MDEHAPWVAQASCLEPGLDQEPDREKPRPRRRRGAARALACGVVGVLFLGFVFGPMAVSLGERLRLAMVASGDHADHADASTLRAAVVLGRIGTAIHLTLAMAALPWLLFMLPMMDTG
jgi:hypothetical protein